MFHRLSAAAPPATIAAALPDPDLLDAWCAAALAYRRERRRSAAAGRAHSTALDAHPAEQPDLDWTEAAHRAAYAIVYMAAQHTAWFWRGITRVARLFGYRCGHRHATVGSPRPAEGGAL